MATVNLTVGPKPVKEGKSNKWRWFVGAQNVGSQNDAKAKLREAVAAHLSKGDKVHVKWTDQTGGGWEADYDPRHGGEMINLREIQSSRPELMPRCHSLPIPEATRAARAKVIRTVPAVAGNNGVVSAKPAKPTTAKPEAKVTPVAAVRPKPAKEQKRPAVAAVVPAKPAKEQKQKRPAVVPAKPAKEQKRPAVAAVVPAKRDTTPKPTTTTARPAPRPASRPAAPAAVAARPSPRPAARPAVTPPARPATPPARPVTAPPPRLVTPPPLVVTQPPVPKPPLRLGGGMVDVTEERPVSRPATRPPPLMSVPRPATVPPPPAPAVLPRSAPAAAPAAGEMSMEDALALLDRQLGAALGNL